MLDLFLKDRTWLYMATPAALIGAAAVVAHARRRRLGRLTACLGAVHLFWALWIGIMGAGHIFAVTTMTLLGSLPASANPWFAIPYGFAISLPGWWLVRVTGGLLGHQRGARITAIALNTWLGLAVVLPAGPVVALPAAVLVLVAFTSKAARPAEPVQ